jgi:hypothetical protein
MVLAWSGSPPPLPQEWADPAWLEYHDTFSVFYGKHWHEVDCSQLPRYFNALTLLTLTETLSAGAPGYYLATYMKCLCFFEGDEQQWAISDVARILEHAVLAPARYGLSEDRCRVITHFLEIKHQDFEEWFHYPLEPWSELVASLPPASPDGKSG